MKSNKGFTLIELLAVIVILAIIALIATPIILNMINDARKSAAVDSAYGYIEAIEYKNSISQLDSTKYKSITTGDVSTINGQVNVKGTQPTSGTVTIENGRVTSATLVINGYTVKYENGKATVDGEKTEDKTEETATGPTSEEPDKTKTKGLLKIVYLDPTDLTKTCTKEDAENNLNENGTPTGIKTGCMKWYAYKDDGINYTMILDHNITASVEWISSSDYTTANTDGTECFFSACNDEGPITITKQLQGDTVGWKGNPKLISADEVAEITGANEILDWTSDKPFKVGPVPGTSISYFYLDGADGTDTIWYTQIAKTQGASKYAWLYDNTYKCTSYGCNIEDSTTTGYWTSTPVASDSSQAWDVSSYGYFSLSPVLEYYGIRPVITINKSIIK